MGISRISDWLHLLGIAKRGTTVHQYSQLHLTNTEEPSRQANVPQDGIGNIPDEDPLDFDNALPLILSPNSAATGIINLWVDQPFVSTVIS